MNNISNTEEIKENHGFKMIISKTEPPTETQSSITRESLIDQALDISKKIIFITAPAGCGKSLFMKQLYQHAVNDKYNVAWLTLDKRDNDLKRFLMYLNAMVQRLLPNHLISTPNIKNAGPGQYFIYKSDANNLIDTIASTPSPFYFFIDDVECIESPEVLQVIQDLLENLLEGQKIIIGSRGSNKLSSKTFETSGKLLKIGADNLRFTTQEVKDFFCVKESIKLSDDDISAIVRKTQGWAAAIRLTLLMLKTQKDHSKWIRHLSGQNTSIAAYLAENVLIGLEDNIRRFLIYTSVLEQPNSDICDFILDINDSIKILSDLFDKNLFISKLSPSLKSGLNTYKLHSLFREFLYEELKKINPSIITELNKKAAIWYAKNNLFRLATEHALSSNDINLTINIMDESIMNLVETGQLETSARWIDCIPNDQVLTRTNFQRAKAYTMIALHRYSDAEDALTQCKLISDSKNENLPIELTIQLSLLHEFSDRHNLTESDIKVFQGNITKENSILYGIAHNIIAYHQIAKNKLSEARETLALAKLGSDNDNTRTWSNTYTLCFEGLIDLIHGNIRGATARFDIAKSKATGASLGVANAFLSRVLYEKGDYVSASILLSEYLNIIRDTADIDTIIMAYRTASRLAFLEGNDHHVEILLSDLSDIGDSRGVVRPKASAWLEKSRYSIIRGDFESARRYLKLAENPKLWEQHQGFNLYANEFEDPQISRIRLNLVMGNTDTIIPEIENLLEKSITEGRIFRGVHLKNLLSQAYFLNGKTKKSAFIFEENINFCYKNTILQTILDEPWQLKELIDNYLLINNKKTSASKEYITKLQCKISLLTRYPGTFVQSTNPHINPLSKREMGIIKLVADGRANKEIAKLLCISENTVESHLKRINQKLETSNRTQAVSCAREIGILN